MKEADARALCHFDPWEKSVVRQRVRFLAPLEMTKFYLTTLPFHSLSLRPRLGRGFSVGPNSIPLASIV